MGVLSMFIVPKHLEIFDMFKRVLWRYAGNQWDLSCWIEISSILGGSRVHDCDCGSVEVGLWIPDMTLNAFDLFRIFEWRFSNFFHVFYHRSVMVSSTAKTAQMKNNATLHKNVRTQPTSCATMEIASLRKKSATKLTTAGTKVMRIFVVSHWDFH